MKKIIIVTLVVAVATMLLLSAVAKSQIQTEQPERTQPIITIAAVTTTLEAKEKITTIPVITKSTTSIEVWSVNEGQQQFNDHTDKLMNYIRYWQASGESAKTSVRIKTRMHQLVEEGYFTRGVVPFGYDLVKKGRLNKKGNEVGDLVVNEEEAYYVRKVFELCVREGKGSHVLAEYLNKNGVRTHNGAKFQATTILRMLANKTYCGYYVTG